MNEWMDEAFRSAKREGITNCYTVGLPQSRQYTRPEIAQLIEAELSPSSFPYPDPGKCLLPSSVPAPSPLSLRCIPGAGLEEKDASASILLRLALTQLSCFRDP